MASTLHSTKIIESSCVAAPSGTTPNCASLPFTHFDVFYVPKSPIERLFFYRYPVPTTHFLSSFLPSLKSSFSLVLKTYYILAGAFRHTPGTDNNLEHYYVEGDGVSFTVAECDGQFEDMASDHERDVSQFQCLVPVLPRSQDLQPLLSVQVTVFPEQGIVLGTSLHHTACDGNSWALFMHTWAGTCLSGALISSLVPLFDRSIISPSDFHSFKALNYNEAPSFHKSAPEFLQIKSPEIVLATFTLTQKHIQRLKQIVSAEQEQRKTTFHCSTIVVVFAYVWTGFVRAKRLDSTKRVSLVIPADYRARMKLPLPSEYFENCVVIAKAVANVADLIQGDSFFVAAEVWAKLLIS